jgi:glycosyltransferase involved in cell wall biosynthesis
VPALPDNVTAVGRTENQHELAAYYSMADLFVITSKRETFPTVCIEALCCGTPVVGFIGGGTAETAPDGYGHFVPFGEAGQLEQAVRAVFKGELKLRSKAECAEFGVSRYNKAAMAEEYLKIYEEREGLEWVTET